MKKVLMDGDYLSPTVIINNTMQFLMKIFKFKNCDEIFKKFSENNN